MDKFTKSNQSMDKFTERTSNRKQTREAKAR